MTIATLIAAAFASALDLERSTLALAEGRPEQALTLARGLVTGPDAEVDAWRTLLAACAATGIDVACRAEAALAGHPNAELALVWHASPDARSAPDGLPEPAALGVEIARLARSSPDTVGARALAVLAAHPDRPDLVLPMFDPSLPPQKALASARAKVLKSGSKAVSRGAAPEVLYRWHRVFVAAGSPLATRSADRLESLGERRPMERRPWTRAEMVARASAMLAAPSADLGSEVPSEREGVALRLCEALSAAGRGGECSALLVEVRASTDSISLALAHGEATLAAGDTAAARRIADEALTLAVGPWPTDVASVDRLGRRQALAKSLALRGRAWLADGDFIAATVDLMVANQLASEPIAIGDLDKAMEKGWFMLQEVKAHLETPSATAAEVALARAHDAISQGDRSAAESAAADAIRVLVLPAQRKSRLSARLPGLPELASAFAARAMVGDGDAARVDIAIASLLVPWDAPATWWERAVELRVDAPYAAFFAAAMAASRGREASAAWPGGGTAGEGAGPALVAEWMRGHPTAEASKDRPVVHRGRVQTFQRPSGGGGARRAEAVPRIGEPFPEWSLQTPHGVVTLRPGRVTMLTFVRMDSPSSKRLLDELTDLARILRKRGADVVLVGVAVDPDQVAFDAAAALREQWGDLGWDPGMGARFGVTAVPTTWVLDAEGIARFHHVGYLGPAEYEAEIRFITGI